MLCWITSEPATGRKCWQHINLWTLAPHKICRKFRKTLITGRFIFRMAIISKYTLVSLNYRLFAQFSPYVPTTKRFIHKELEVSIVNTKSFLRYGAQEINIYSMQFSRIRVQHDSFGRKDWEIALPSSTFLCWLRVENRIEWRKNIVRWLNFVPTSTTLRCRI